MILIVGCGAIGSIFAGHLAQVTDVAVMDADQRHCQALAQNGIKMEGKVELSSVLRLAVTPKRVEELAKHSIDYILVATKSLHTRSALQTIRPYVANNPVVISVQNGWGNLQEIEAAGFHRIILGSTKNAAEIIAPGRVLREMAGNTWIGPVQGVTLAEAEAVSELLTRSGLPTEAVSDPRGHIWAKLLFNAAINPVTALSQISARFLVEMEEGQTLLRAVLSESMQVARAMDLTLPYDPVAVTLAPRPKGQAHMSSMAQDVRNRRQTEIDFLNGAIVQEGLRMGVPTPVNAMLVHLIHLVEASWNLSSATESLP